MRRRRETLRFYVLGPVQVVSRDEIAMARPAQRRLMAILLLESERRLGTDLLIDRFWSEDPPRTARAALQTHVSQLRKRLGHGVITSDPAGYQVDLNGHELDLFEFDAAARAAAEAHEKGAWTEVADRAAVALQMWRGRPFPELEDDAFAAPEIARLEELQAELIEMRAEALLALGRDEAALPELERVIHEHPHRERLWAHLMVARARLGRTAEALAAYHEARATMDELGLEPGASLRALEERILREDPSLVPPRIRHNLPTVLTSFIGREVERQDVAQALATNRMVTLTGVGGVGKTRLALSVGEEVKVVYPDGLWLVDLAPLTDQDLVMSAVAVTLGLRHEGGSVTDAIRAALRNRQTLIILDNCEHLLGSAAEAAYLLLASGPGVSVLATSRAPLGMSGEQVYRLEPLPLPDDAQQDAGPISSNDAVRLFVDRAELVAGDFPVNASNASTIASICRRLDGLPLAIELAAARMGSLSPEDVADRLDNRFRLLARGQRTLPARHETLEATVAWSYDHLSETERTLFCRLAVFSGQFTLRAAEEVCPGEGLATEQVASLLAALVERSLVVSIESDDLRRYRLLETIRQFARDRLMSVPSAGEVRRRHRDHFLRIAEERFSGSGFDWLDSIAAWLDDSAAALDWSLSTDSPRPAAILAAALAEYWDFAGQPGRGVAVVRTALASLDLAAEPERAADLQSVLSGALFAIGDSHGAFVAAQAAERLVAGRPPSREKLLALGNLASVHRLLTDHDPADAIVPAREAVAVAEAMEDQRALRFAFSNLGLALGWSGDIGEGLRYTRKALEIAERMGSAPLILASYHALFDQLMLHPEKRRTEPPRIAHEVMRRFGSDRSLDQFMPWGWIGYSFLLAGEWGLADQVVARKEDLDRDGFELTHLRHLRGCLRWMQGRIAEATTDIAAAAGASDLSDRWYHDIFDLQASLAAERGDLEQVRKATHRYLETTVHSAEEAMKSAVLRSLVRAEVDAALSSEREARSDHEHRALEAFERMQELNARYPHPTGATVQLEGASFNLLISEAELSRLTAPQPDRWQAAEEEATYAYWKAYAAWRRAEALLVAGRTSEGAEALRAASRRATALGASLLVHRLEELSAGLRLTPGSPRPGQ